MTDNVVGIRGQLPPLVSLPPNEEMIAMLERVLEKARAGEARGIIGIFVYADHSTEAICAGALTYANIGRAFCVLTKMARELEEQP
jgi:hypothetical protein